MTVNTKIGKITASKATLNYLSMALYDAADYLQARKGIEKRDVYGYDTVSSEIFNALEKTGFYHI